MKNIINVQFVLMSLDIWQVQVKNDWTKIINLGEQTKILDNLELLNLKSVQKSISKNENIKEVNIVNALKSIKKLKKYGVNH